MKILHLSLIAYVLTGATVAIANADEQGNPEPQLTLELLEFLGDFTTADGKWVDPMEVTTMLEETPVNIEEQTEKTE